MLASQICRSSRLYRPTRVFNIKPVIRRSYAQQADKPKVHLTWDGKVLFTLATPAEAFIQEQPIDSVVLPGIEGEFQVLPNLAPVITELKPGVVVVAGIEGATKKYFISGGFALVHSDSTCSCNPVECVEVSSLDADLARASLAKSQLKFNSAQNEHDKAVAQIEVETANDILAAIHAK